MGLPCTVSADAERRVDHVVELERDRRRYALGVHGQLRFRPGASFDP